MRQLTYAQALNEALNEEMLRDVNVVVFGEDVAGIGGRNGVTSGLLKRFGRGRVINTPLNEEIFVGVGLGAAAGGLKPVVELLYSDFLRIALDDLHRASAWASLKDSSNSPTLLVRTAFGGYAGRGPEYSSANVSELLAVPMLRVLTPCQPSDAGGFLHWGLNTPGVNVLLEHKALYRSIGDVPAPGSGIEIAPGSARMAFEGSDILIVAYSYQVLLAMAAARRLRQEEGVSVGVLDLRSLNPLDWEAIYQGAERFGKLVLAEECSEASGIMSRIAAGVYRRHPECRIEQVNPVERFVPFGPREKEMLPSVEDLMEACLNLNRGLAGNDQGH